MANATVYRSRVDWWIALLVFVLPPAMFVWIALQDSRATNIMGLSAALYALVILVIAWPLSYTVDDEQILVRVGLVIRIRVPLRTIVSMALTRNPLSSPAMSLHRMAIGYRNSKGKKRTLIISPPDRLAFMKDVADRDEGLHMQGERVIRR